MVDRRKVVKLLSVAVSAGIIGSGALFSCVQQVYATLKRRLVAPGTPMSKLMHAHPARLDTTQLEITPFDQFDVMGETTHTVDIAQWRLIIDGDVTTPAALSYEEVLSRPLLACNALLICPGFFAYNGFWEGVSVARLLEETGVKQEASHVLFSGSAGFRKKKRRFSLEEVDNDRVFLAYRVNEVVLPQRHGYPLRLVAVDHRGAKWVKYINRITVETR